MSFRCVWLVCLLLAFAVCADLSPEYFRGIQATLAQEEAEAKTVSANVSAASRKELSVPKWEAPPPLWAIPLLCWCSALACLFLAAWPLVRNWCRRREQRRLEQLLAYGSREEVRAAFAKIAQLPPGVDFQELAEAFPHSPWQEQLRRREEQW